MKTKILPLKNSSIAEIYNGERATYEIPIYQRNYAWEKDEISTLIQDVYDAYNPSNGDQNYYIGTLVTFHKGDQVYEVIDGQQRMTTIYLVLRVLGITFKNSLTYRAREKSNRTIKACFCVDKNISSLEVEETDYGIINGYNYIKNAIKEIVQDEHKDGFKDYFQNMVNLIHYHVPKDIDLNHYFEIMNSRGEQLEKHEIVKARLIEKLKNNQDKAKFNRLWEFCSEMNVYIQQKYPDTYIFGSNHSDFNVKNFDDLPIIDDDKGKKKIIELINYKVADKKQIVNDKIDTFQPILDFSNFLLIVLKLTRIEEICLKQKSFNLDDKELINMFFPKNEHDNEQIDEAFVKKFGFNLLKAKYFLDNYIVHHSNEDDTIENNPWKLQYWQIDGKNKGYLKNLDGESNDQHKLVQLLSMFEVTFSARQRKNYLFYCLLYLFSSVDRNIGKYCEFVSALADKFFKDVYMNHEKLNEINTPNPGSFDETVIPDNKLNTIPQVDTDISDFNRIYGDGTTKSKGIPLFIFNYLDYKLWEKYAIEIRGKDAKKVSNERIEFFNALGCSDFGLEAFKQFYFSKTRRTLEHYYPQAEAGKNGAPTKEQINCFGNYAMIGGQANSSGSNWTPKTKNNHYLDSSRKIKLVSVASLKLMIMMQKCIDNESINRKSEQEWTFIDIKEHQGKMIKILLG